ncbi:hypothetical protein Gpo141_00002963 [Globisporangium polare]
MMPEMEQQQLSSSSSFSTPSNNNNSNGNGASSHAPFSSTIGSSSGVNGNGSAVAGAAATADAEAREWLAQREAKVERELYSGLQKRMDAQRKQVLAFKTEQTKWENKLQLKIQKYAHDRKLLGEHNIELQAALSALEGKFAKQQKEMDAQTTHIIALESLLREKAMESEELQKVKRQNEELQERVAKWERYHRAEAAAAEQARQQEQEELLNHIEHNLLAISLGDASSAGATGSQSLPGVEKLSRRRSAPDGTAVRRSGSGSSFTDEEAMSARIAELEKLCKQKDQSIHSLKGVLERQESVLDEKLKLTSAKYDQVKAINLALQKRLLNSLTESTAGRNSG